MSLDDERLNDLGSHSYAGDGIQYIIAGRRSVKLEQISAPLSSQQRACSHSWFGCQRIGAAVCVGGESEMRRALGLRPAGPDY